MCKGLSGCSIGDELHSDRAKRSHFASAAECTWNWKIKDLGNSLGSIVSKLYNSTCPIGGEYPVTGAPCSVEFPPEGQQLSHWTGGILRLCIAFLEMGACVFFALSPSFHLISCT